MQNLVETRTSIMKSSLNDSCEREVAMLNLALYIHHSSRPFDDSSSERLNNIDHNIDKRVDNYRHNGKALRNLLAFVDYGRQEVRRGVGLGLKCR